MHVRRTPACVPRQLSPAAARKGLAGQLPGENYPYPSHQPTLTHPTHLYAQELLPGLRQKRPLHVRRTPALLWRLSPAAAHRGLGEKLLGAKLLTWHLQLLVDVGEGKGKGGKEVRARAIGKGGERQQ